MRILVSGAEGYIGTILTTFLLENGYDIVGLDTGFFNNCNLYNSYLKNIEILRKDIRNVKPEDLKDFDAIIHLAELSNDPLGQIRPEVTIDINYNGSKRLANLAKIAGIKQFIYISSCSVYGIAQKEIVTEDYSTNPQTEYPTNQTMCPAPPGRDLQQWHGP